MEFLKRLPIWFYCVVVLLVGGAVYHGLAWYQLNKINNALMNPDRISIDENTPALLVFAKARHLDKTGSSGEAIPLYSSLRTTEDSELRTRALYNLATLYLKDGAKRWNAHGVLEATHVSTEIELAKENYREALRLCPELWDARFNLEYAWRITPPPKERGKADFQGTKSSVFSTLPGLPAGGP